MKNNLFGNKNSKNTPDGIEMFNTEISEDARSKIKWKGKDNEEVGSKPEEKPDGEVVKIPVVELFDESGDKVVFQLLDTIEFENDKYNVLTPYYETAEEYDLENPADAFIMKEVINNATNEPMLETVEDQDILQTVYGLFKSKHSSEYEFRDS